MAEDSEKPSTTRDQSVLVTSCSNRRTNSSSSSSEPVNFSLSDLQVLLTEEVLQRLSTTKSAFLCKCVCKNWYSLISSPYFVRRFITHHLNHRYEQNPSALFVNYLTGSYDFGLFIFSDEPMFKSSGLELKYLPERNGSVIVVATSNDLMLCYVDKYKFGRSQFYYYICNPFTMQWVALPLLELDRDEFDPAGFVCEPYYSQDDKGECTINSNYRFRVVHFSIAESPQIVLWTYRSETQQWYRSVLEGSEYEWSSDVVACNGKLLWYNGERIFAYDPFHPELSTFVDCSYIHSTKFPSLSSIYYIGVCRGFLRMMQLVSDGNVQALAIWELKDYTTGEWSLVDQIDGMMPENSLLEQNLDGNKLTLQPLGFHPNDGAIVYLQFRNSVISCNTRTRELKMVTDVPGTCCDPGRLYLIELPLWPTPMPKRIEILPGS